MPTFVVVPPTVRDTWRILWSVSLLYVFKHNPSNSLTLTSTNVLHHLQFLSFICQFSLFYKERMLIHCETDRFQWRVVQPTSYCQQYQLVIREILWWGRCQRHFTKGSEVWYGKEATYMQRLKRLLTTEIWISYKLHTYLSVCNEEMKSNMRISYLLNSPFNSVALVRERTIPTERPPPVGEVSANFCG